MQEIANKRAAASGTPFASFFPIEEVAKIAKEVGLKEIQTVSTKEMTDMYFKKTCNALHKAVLSAVLSGCFVIIRICS